MYKGYWFLGVFIGLGLIISSQSCKPSDPRPTKVSYLEVPIGFPDISFPEDNSFTNKRWELGKKLFFDPVLSKDSTISCASCHKPEFAFADNQATSVGVFGRAGTRNSPSLANVGYFPYFIREGSVPTLEMQILVPIQEHNEFNTNIVDLSEKLKGIPTYAQLSKIAYGRTIDPFVITRSIATFERSIISGKSPFDDFLNGKKEALTKVEMEGMKLFHSKRTNCSVCHSGILFTSHKFENNGLYESYQDIGRMRFTNLEKDRALFKTPSIRNVGLTAPYMHDGSLSTLEEVVNHYNLGGKNHANKSELIKPLNLNIKEKEALISFLNSLSDFSFINDSKWK